MANEAYAAQTLNAIRGIIADWRKNTHSPDPAEMAMEMRTYLDAIETILDEPTPEAAAECAENSAPSSGSRQDEGP